MTDPQRRNAAAIAHHLASTREALHSQSLQFPAPWNSGNQGRAGGCAVRTGESRFALWRLPGHANCGCASAAPRASVCVTEPSARIPICVSHTLAEEDSASTTTRRHLMSVSMSGPSCSVRTRTCLRLHVRCARHTRTEEPRGYFEPRPGSLP